MFAVYRDRNGHHVMVIEDGRCWAVASCGSDVALAEQLRDWLTNRDRIDQLLARHGLVDVPLDEVPH